MRARLRLEGLRLPPSQGATGRAFWSAVKLMFIRIAAYWACPETGGAAISGCWSMGAVIYLCPVLGGVSSTPPAPPPPRRRAGAATPTPPPPPLKPCPLFAEIIIARQDGAAVKSAVNRLADHHRSVFYNFNFQHHAASYVAVKFRVQAASIDRET